MEPKQNYHPVVDVTGDRSNVRCCKEQYCIGTWNQVHESSQTGNGQTGVNVNILGINKLKWTRMGEFNSDDHYIYYCVKSPLEEME